MPRCEGLPSGPCPAGVNDATVRSTQGDLFLCRSCEEERFPYITVVNKNKRNANNKKPASQAGPALSGSMASIGSASGPGIEDTPSVSLLPESLMTRSAPQPLKSPGATDHSACPCCFLQVSGKRSVSCDICQYAYHQQCTQLSAKVFDKFIPLRQSVGWVCDDCKLTAQSLKSQLLSANAHLAEQIAEMKSDIESLKSLSGAVNNNKAQSLPSDRQPSRDSDKRVTMIVHRTLGDVSRRKRNVVVCGLPEGQTPSDDREAFLQLCEAYMPIKPVVQDNNCVRLGKNISDRPRRLLVRLESEEAASVILKSAPALRKSTDDWIARSVFINPDLSPAAAKLAYEQRQLRRQRDTVRQVRAPSMSADTSRGSSREQVQDQNTDQDHLTSPQVVLEARSDQPSAQQALDHNSCTAALSPFAEPFQN